MTPDPDSPGLWAETAPPAPEAPPLDRDAVADIAVVGAGYTGLAAALTAAEAGARVTVLEAERIGAGGSGRNVGLVNAGLWLMPEEMERRLARRGADRALAQMLADAPAAVWDMVARHGIECEARPAGTLHCAADAAGLSALDARARQWQARGATVELLDGAATRARTGSEAFRAALFDPRAGTIQPLAYARGLARAAIGAGAAVHVGSPVQTARRDGGDWVLTTPGGTLRAPRVIWAGNAYGQGPAADPARALATLPYFSFATDPLPADLRADILPGGEGAWDTAKILTSFRLDAAGRFIIGSVGQLGAPDMATHRAWAERRMARLYPQLAGQELKHGWWGRIGTTPDALPRLWQPGEGAFGYLGFNGRGIGPGTVLGQCLARAALGTGDLLHLDAPAPDPLRSARNLLYRGGAALWHLAIRRP
ncbi:FAD-binding oxidoreductase [Pararhodobacter sp. SW119]|uniref:NAD(P)/FAD-dependent oxidoreductase n=1 Tax=Pararhodobacter sp. SW119 TaxID=2780075 RepID=UPI001ADEED51|nr:FAD-binding oxidoreductase [Pararhodobacter sp. SW119]